MCYITRKVFPCCGVENWYSRPIPQQCNGAKRCSSGECIILHRYATVLTSGRCWRCILGDFNRGVRTGISDVVLKEAQKRAEHSLRGAAGGAIADRIVPLKKRAKKRKRDPREVSIESLALHGVNRPAKRIKWEELYENQKPIKVYKNSARARALAQKKPPETPPKKGPRARARAQKTPPATPPKMPPVVPVPKFPWPSQVVAPVQYSTPYPPLPSLIHPPADFAQSNLAYNYSQHNSSLYPALFSLDVDMGNFSNMTIDPSLLMSNAGTFDTPLTDIPGAESHSLQFPQYSTMGAASNGVNGSFSVEQVVPFGQSAYYSVPGPEDMLFWDDTQFVSQWPGVTIAQAGMPPAANTPNINLLNQEPLATVYPISNNAANLASVPLGDPMLYQSELSNFDDLIQWPEFENYGFPKVDEQFKQQLDDILFGPLESGGQ